MKERCAVAFAELGIDNELGDCSVIAEILYTTECRLGVVEILVKCSVLMRRYSAVICLDHQTRTRDEYGDYSKRQLY